MFNDPVSFNGDTRVEVIAVLANCGRDTDRARRALVTWIRRKQVKGRTTEHILLKLRDIESKFIKDLSLHDAFRDARAETFLPRAPDLPLPSSLNRRSGGLSPDIVSPMSSSQRQDLIDPSPTSSSPTDRSFHMIRRFTPPSSSSRYPRNSSQTLEITHEKRDIDRRPSSTRTEHHTPNSVWVSRRPSMPYRPDSPITSSPEESGPRFRVNHVSAPAGPLPHPRDLPTPPSTSPYSQISFPNAQSRRAIPIPAQPFSSGESAKYRPVSTSPIRRRVTPPMTIPPDVPLPPVPTKRKDAVLDKPTLNREQPPTPTESPTFTSTSTPVRALPNQPIPSPALDVDDIDYPLPLSRHSSQHHLRESISPYPSSEDIVRKDSPVFVLSQTGIGPPPPYAARRNTHSPPDIPICGDTLDRAVNICGASPDVRRIVCRCIGFEQGYEPPYWQTRLQAAGLNLQAAQYLADEMWKQVDRPRVRGKAGRT